MSQPGHEALKDQLLACLPVSRPHLQARLSQMPTLTVFVMAWPDTSPSHLPLPAPAPQTQLLQPPEASPALSARGSLGAARGLLHHAVSLVLGWGLVHLPPHPAAQSQAHRRCSANGLMNDGWLLSERQGAGRDSLGYCSAFAGRGRKDNPTIRAGKGVPSPPTPFLAQPCSCTQPPVGSRRCQPRAQQGPCGNV